MKLIEELTEDFRSPEYWLINTNFYNKIKIPLKIITKTDKKLPPTHHYTNSLLYLGEVGDNTFSAGIFLCIMDI
ncbi:hypothetical protein HFZ78_01755 [Priestia megaterium]|uniref:Uncharacterized protein n=1 Tax=Priestia megaterium TaxID=1404 RepID=A0A6H1NWE9_PRIMG|nr:hypothetical protein [Priestia megaterium]QIZ05624.1 hypothetical protein HFZ78_01755 [Priestia megaterium]